MPAAPFFKQLGLYVVPKFFDLDRSAGFCRHMAVASAEKALVFGPRGEARLDLDSRKVDAMILPHEITEPVKSTLLRLLPELERHFQIELAGCELPQYLVYRAGYFFKPHTDHSGYKFKDGTQRRRVTAVIFLNRQSGAPAVDAYGGGQLTFYGLLEEPRWDKCGFPLNADPGLLIAFPSDKWHEVKPVSHGRRFTIVTWFYGPETPIISDRAD